jgi:hypothetical protein
MVTENPGARLGDLLTNAGLLKIEALREAMLTAKQQGMPVGRILITSGFLTENQLQAAVQAQSMLKDGLVDMYVVVKALSIIASEQTSLDNALARVGWRKQSDAVSNKLGELLLEAGVISQADLDHALSQCQSIGLPLGRMLVLTGCLSEQMLTNALNAQVFLRDKKISRQQALTGLKAAQHRQLPLETALDDSEFQLPSATHVRLGELLIESGLVDQANLMNAVELGLLQDKLLGQVLRQLNLLNEQDLAASLELQKMVSGGAIRRADAVELLKQCHNENANIQDVLKRKQPLERPAPPDARDDLFLDQFLKIAGIITQADIDRAVKLGSQNSDIFGKMLQTAGIMEEQMVEASLDAYALVSDNTLTMDQAMIALKNCQANGHDLESAFKALGWAAEDDDENFGIAEDEPAEEKDQAPPATAAARSAVDLMPAPDEPKPASTTFAPSVNNERVKTGSFAAINSNDSPASMAAKEPITPTSQIAATTNPLRSTSEHPIITPVVSKRTIEIEKSSLGQTAAESAKASEEKPAEKPAETRAPEKREEEKQDASATERAASEREAKRGRDSESVSVGDGGPPAWATPVESFSSLTSRAPAATVPQSDLPAGPAEFDQFSQTAEDMPAASIDNSLTTTSSFAALKSAPPTKRKSQWLEAIEEEPIPTIPPGASHQRPKTEPAPVSASSPAAQKPAAPAETSPESTFAEQLPSPTETTSTVVASAPAAAVPSDLNSVLGKLNRGAPTDSPLLPPPIPSPDSIPPVAPLDSPPQTAAAPDLSQAQESQPMTEAAKTPLVAPTIVPGRLSKSLPQPASSLRKTGAQETPPQSAWGFGSAQPPKSNPWDVTEEEEQAASAANATPQPAQAQTPVPAPTPPQAEQPPLPPQAPPLAPTLVPPPAPPVTPESIQPTVPMPHVAPAQNYDQSQQAPAGWGSAGQKAPPPNPWAASQRASGEIPIPSGRPAVPMTQLDMSMSNTAPMPQPYADAPAGEAASAVQPPPPAPEPAPISTPFPQTGAPGWTSPAQENPGWGSQTSQPDQNALSSFSNNPGWRPSIPAASPPPAPPPPAPAPPPAPTPQAPQAAPAPQPVPERAKEGWEYNGQSGTPPAKPKGLNAFMPKVKKDK